MKRNTFIQWKGTDVCMDVYCPSCGHHFHVDGEFAYVVTCPKCDQSYEVGTNVELTPTDRKMNSRIQVH